MRWFEAHYRLASVVKRALLPEWLADSLNDRFDADLGLMQTTRLPVHQTKVRLIAAAIDATEQADNTTIELAGVDPPLMERGLTLCVERHRQAWRDLGLGEPPSLAHAFELYAEDGREPAFMQCPEPLDRAPIAEERGIKLLPDFGFAVPSLEPAREPTQLAFQLMAFAGKQFYVKGQPTSSRPLAQAVAIDLPGRPAWRLRHEVETTLGWLPFARDQLGFAGAITFAWLLPFAAGERPIPRRHQHPCLLDVSAPLRVRRDGHIAVYSKTCRIGGSDMQLSNAALGPREAWVATGLPGIALAPATSRRAGRGRKEGKAGKADALAALGLEAKPDLMQRPFGKVPRSADIVGIIETARLGGSNEIVGVPALDIYRSEQRDSFDLPRGAELVIEGEPIGQSTTESWIEVRVPLPDPAAGPERLRGRWSRWCAVAKHQLERRSECAARLDNAIEHAFLRRHQASGRKTGRKTHNRSRTFARRWVDSFELATDGPLWYVASRTWDDETQNKRDWLAVLAQAEREAARRAFEALGGFDDPATVVAAARSGLLALIEGRREGAA